MKDLNCLSFDSNLLFSDASTTSQSGPITSGVDFQEMERTFKFNSMRNKVESIHILLAIQILNIDFQSQSFFVTPDKMMKLEDFNKVLDKHVNKNLFEKKNGRWSPIFEID